MPSIRIAVKMHKRPTAAIMGDDWFGHRDPLTGEPQGDREEYSSWDWSLLNAFQTIEDYTDSKSGLLIWEMDDERVLVDAKRKVSKFQRSIDEKTKGTDKKPYKPIPGEYFIPEMWSREKDDQGNDIFQTMREWVDKSIAEGQD